jgi:hypothetical protein
MYTNQKVGSKLNNALLLDLTVTKHEIISGDISHSQSI